MLTNDPSFRSDQSNVERPRLPRRPTIVDLDALERGLSRRTAPAADSSSVPLSLDSLHISSDTSVSSKAESTRPASWLTAELSQRDRRGESKPTLHRIYEGTLDRLFVERQEKKGVVAHRNGLATQRRSAWVSAPPIFINAKCVAGFAEAIAAIGETASGSAMINRLKHLTESLLVAPLPIKDSSPLTSQVKLSDDTAAVPVSVIPFNPGDAVVWEDGTCTSSAMQLARSLERAVKRHSDSPQKELGKSVEEEVALRLKEHLPTTERVLGEYPSISVCSVVPKPPTASNRSSDTSLTSSARRRERTFKVSIAVLQDSYQRVVELEHERQEHYERSLRDQRNESGNERYGTRPASRQDYQQELRSFDLEIVTAQAKHQREKAVMLAYLRRLQEDTP